MSLAYQTQSKPWVDISAVGDDKKRIATSFYICPSDMDPKTANLSELIPMKYFKGFAFTGTKRFENYEVPYVLPSEEYVREVIKKATKGSAYDTMYQRSSGGNGDDTAADCAKEFTYAQATERNVQRSDSVRTIRKYTKMPNGDSVIVITDFKVQQHEPEPIEPVDVFSWIDATGTGREASIQQSPEPGPSKRRRQDAGPNVGSVVGLEENNPWTSQQAFIQEMGSFSSQPQILPGQTSHMQYPPSGPQSHLPQSTGAQDIPASLYTQHPISQMYPTYQSANNDMPISLLPQANLAEDTRPESAPYILDVHYKRHPNDPWQPSEGPRLVGLVGYLDPAPDDHSNITWVRASVPHPTTYKNAFGLPFHDDWTDPEAIKVADEACKQTYAGLDKTCLLDVPLIDGSSVHFASCVRKRTGGAGTAERPINVDT